MTQSPRWFVRPWFIAVVVAVLYALLVVGINGGDPLALVTIGTRFDPGIPEEDGGTEGYDGQFVYFIARDASTAADFITNGGDFAAYRFQRILLPAAGKAVSLGQSDFIPWALLLVNVAALGVGTAALEHLLRVRGVSRYYALGWALSLAILGTVRLSLPEALAYGLALCGMVLVRQDRWLWSAVVFALAILAKETAIFFPAGYGIYWLFIARQPRKAIVFGAVVLLPFILWQGVLYAQFGEFGVGSGGAGTTGFTPIPFGGVIAIVVEAVSVVGGAISDGDTTLLNGIFRLVLALFIFGAILIPFVLLPTLWLLRQTVRKLRAGTVTPLLVVAVLNAGIMLFVPFSTYREPLGILRFIAGLQIVVILYAAEYKHRRTLRYTPLFILSMLFLLGSDLAGGVQ